MIVLDSACKTSRRLYFVVRLIINNNNSYYVVFLRLRDLHLSYQRWVTPQQKRLAAAFNWDANRDPSQKVSIDIQLDNKGTWHHGGYVTFYYPGRLVNADFEFLLRGKLKKLEILMTFCC